MTHHDYVWPPLLTGQDCFVLAGPLCAALSSCHSDAEKRSRSSPMVYIQMVHKLSFIQNCEWPVKMCVCVCVYCIAYTCISTGMSRETKKIQVLFPLEAKVMFHWTSGSERMSGKKTRSGSSMMMGIPILPFLRGKSFMRSDCMGVSKNKGTPKWMVYNGKPY